MNNLDITLTLSEYIRRMSSADAREWLPSPAETVVLLIVEDKPALRIINADYNIDTLYKEFPYIVETNKRQNILCKGSIQVVVSPVMY